jgi:hypothetical protein
VFCPNSSPEPSEEKVPSPSSSHREKLAIGSKLSNIGVCKISHVLSLNSEPGWQLSFSWCLVTVVVPAVVIMMSS